MKIENKNPNQNLFLAKNYVNIAEISILGRKHLFMRIFFFNSLKPNSEEQTVQIDGSTPKYRLQSGTIKESQREACLYL